MRLLLLLIFILGIRLVRARGKLRRDSRPWRRSRSMQPLCREAEAHGAGAGIFAVGELPQLIMFCKIQERFPSET